MKQTRYILILLLIVSSKLTAEDGSKLWLRYESLNHERREQYAEFVGFDCQEQSPTLNIASQELQEGWVKLFGTKPTSKGKGNTLVIGTIRNPRIKSLLASSTLPPLDDDGFVIRSVRKEGQTYLVVASNTDVGVLYGVFHLLRMVKTTHTPIGQLDVSEKPLYKGRILNHWDNLEGSIERGYTGRSLWKWDDLPQTVSPRYQEYARANASIGINGTVLNNVNANPKILTPEYLQKVKVLADIFRPYGLKVYLSVNFSSPKELGRLPDSDPLNPDVQRWWQQKAKEIYALIPDFGGFLVKANSEGLPGPQDYGRTHADGANMLADALKPYHGIVMWRAFVYNPSGHDRAMQAYQEFVPLDGQFRENVIIQVKNGPIDFQPREPFSPLFGAMRKTPVMPEFQITQEYLGFSNHLVYLAPLFKETLESDTYADGEGSTVAKITDGSLRSTPFPAICGVANIGEDTNWCGHDFAQANWYAFGRLAWNHQLTAEQIAHEWLQQTFSDDKAFVEPITDMMMNSREAAVEYMMPLGLHHLFAFGHHYGPEPWCDVPNARADWLPSYYHNADSLGVGFDRSAKGSNAASQYFAPLSELYGNMATCPEEYLLWFHHVPWQYEMKSGRTLWAELCYTYDAGVQQTRNFQKTWDKAQSWVDRKRFTSVQSKLRIQSRDAVWWKDACLLYFQTFSQMPIPYDIERPIHELDELKTIHLDLTHHN